MLRPLFAVLPIVSAISNAQDPSAAEAAGRWAQALRARDFAEADRRLAELEGRGEASLAEALETARWVGEETRAAYSALGKRVGAGGPFPASLGARTELQGRVVSSGPEEFVLRDRRQEARHRWTELPIASVGEFLHAQQMDPEEEALGCALLALAGEASAARAALAALARKPSNPTVERVRAAATAFEGWAAEAVALEAADAILAEGAEARSARQAAQRLGRDEAARNSTAYRRLRGTLVEALATALAGPSVSLAEILGLRGAVSISGEGVEVIYDFDEARQGEDFAPEPYPRLEAAAKRVWGASSQGAIRPWRIERGEWIGEWNALARHRVVWEGFPQVGFDQRLETVRGLEVPSNATAGVALGDDGDGSFVAWLSGGTLVTVSRGRADASGMTKPEGATKTIGERYRLDFVPEGTAATTLRDGLPVARHPLPETGGGGLIFFVHGEIRGVLDDLVIRGRPDPHWVRERRLERVRSEAEALLPPSR